ncbi:CaiB/BaiF CoA-transferase family protein [Bosea sp. (in: a-proteobacteria)]|jgi:crotonobetainyl-CoA:carnitine CoA-transferase CaiB-like acyl-CoA transferase|uniref:CaiB/BaiF CoA transferase family protein n=1 Tax=Bosea sp. (in: a-proteobacteria) TaxID=1871050 RepID=UPI001ACA9D0B|nr:CaiB/BaiF CoA-transferase family protein [Bosea sp. (in: a-proteobacteria)]MBN9437746.1 CoA transferase [Bosea sp. (in: a-proteobacteria)]MBN9449316.1 CoA transferase [Bosea sp. (in: a-proteobacteria)]MBN9469875.1 CoA transferase [Bosea sp. (in: a-proteobacteria)]
MPRPTPSSALENLRVLDLSRVRAGPTCARIFADFGADVLKIESPPGVDPNENMSGARHGYDMQNLHRNKRSLTLNLKKESGKAVLRRLIADADLLIENFRPDVKDRLGLDFETLHALNPRLILVSVSGFGQSGPYRLRAGFDQIAQGMGGMMSVTGLPGQGPVRAGIAVADSAAGLYGAIGALVALQERAVSGKGQWVQTSLLEAQIAMMDFQAARFLVEGTVPPQAGNDHPYATPMGVYATRDGHINLGVGAEGHWRSFCGVLGRPELASDPRYDSVEKRFAARPELRVLLEEIMSTQDSAHWLDACEKASVPAGPIYSVDAMFDDPQVQHLGIAQPVTHPVLGDIRVIGEPVGLSRTPASVVSPTPDAGEHNDEILAELGYDAAAIAQLRADGAI